MATVLGIVGSATKESLTCQIVLKALEGAASVGAQTQVRYLGELDIKPCCACAGTRCWAGEKCKYDDDAAKIQEELRACDAFIIGAPAYFMDVNGLTKNFIDRMRLGDTCNGKRALGITVAAGTGRGMVLALKALYHFFFLTGMRGLTPTPVSRYNFDAGMRMAYQNGAALAKGPIERIPFHNMGERVSWTLQLPFLGHDIVDENLYLAKVVLDSCRKTEENAALLAEARNCLMRAAQLVEQHKKREAVEHIMTAYDTATQAWKMGIRPPSPAPASPSAK